MYPYSTRNRDELATASIAGTTLHSSYVRIGLMILQEDIRTKGDCCFNHIIGLPTKDGVEKPIFDYEKSLYDDLVDSDYQDQSIINFKQRVPFVY